MKYIWVCRRTFVAIFAISCLTAIGVMTDLDVASAIATTALAVAGANSAQKIFQREDNPPGALKPKKGSK